MLLYQPEGFSLSISNWRWGMEMYACNVYLMVWMHGMDVCLMVCKCMEGTCMVWKCMPHLQAKEFQQDLFQTCTFVHPYSITYCDKHSRSPFSFHWLSQVHFLKNGHPITTNLDKISLSSNPWFPSCAEINIIAMLSQNMQTRLFLFSIAISPTLPTMKWCVWLDFAEFLQCGCCYSRDDKNTGTIYRISKDQRTLIFICNLALGKSSTASQ